MLLNFNVYFIHISVLNCVLLKQWNNALLLFWITMIGRYINIIIPALILLINFFTQYTQKFNYITHFNTDQKMKPEPP